MHYASICKKVSVSFHEESACEPLPWVFHLRVAEGEPYFLHLSFLEESVDNLDVGSEECHVFQVFLHSLFCARMHSCAFYVHSDEVDVGEELGQSYGVFTLAASEFEHYGVVVMEIAASP